jgi:threonine dehydrogenase-like Zn-dependent dehydrogenase
MPRELIAIGPRTPILREYEEPALGACQVRIRTEFASPKHGTELVGYRNDPGARRQYDREWGAVMPLNPAAGDGFPMSLGNMAVGCVSEVGPGVTRFQVGDRVFGHWPIRETHTVDQHSIDPLPEGLSAEAAVCLDPALNALPIRYGGIRIGDRVAVFGMGAIGVLAVQLARIAGADLVIAVDPLAGRRELALQHSADFALDPRQDDGDVGLVIRNITRPSNASRGTVENPATTHVVGGFRDRPSQLTELGVDVAVEVSGNVRALHDAIRATRFGGTVCVLSYYGGDSAGLYLGEEFHINELQLVSARAGSLPLRDSPGWTYTRLVETALAWLVSGRLKVDGIITPIVPFEDAAAAYRAIDEHPEESVKLGITFPA